MVNIKIINIGNIKYMNIDICNLGLTYAPKCQKLFSSFKKERGKRLNSKTKVCVKECFKYIYLSFLLSFIFFQQSQNSKNKKKPKLTIKSTSSFKLSKAAVQIHVQLK